MNEAENLPVPQPEFNDLPVVQPKLEESQDWVIETYRKQRLEEVTLWLNEHIGEGRHSRNYIPPVFLDLNEIRHRQSLQEQVFPNPRRIHEDFLDVNHLKIWIQAESGMGKTTYFHYYVEELLNKTPHPVYPMPIYFDMGNLPEGSGFSPFLERMTNEVSALVLLEQNEVEGLELNEEILRRTIHSILLSGRILFLLDGLDELEVQDRFHLYNEIFIDDKTFRSNQVLIASRPFKLGPLATESLVQRGQDGAFQVRTQALDAMDRRSYLPDNLLTRELKLAKLYDPELLSTPILLNLIKTLSDKERLQDCKSRGEIYHSYVESLFDPEPEKVVKEEAGGDGDSGDKDNDNDAGDEAKDNSNEQDDEINAEKNGNDRDACFEQLSKEEIAKINHELERLSFELIDENGSQRWEEVETSYSRKILEDKQLISLLDEKYSAVVGKFIKQNTDRWEYRHASFQEYFAARYLCQQADWQVVVADHCREDGWEQTFKFLAGMVNANDMFEILLDHGAVFLAGNAIPEAKNLSQDKRLLIDQLLKYQCRESLPQFSNCRLVKTQEVIDACERSILDKRIGQLLNRKNRDCRILFATLELLMVLHGKSIVEIMDTFNFSTLIELPEMKDFLTEHKDPQVVNMKAMKRWAEQVTIPKGKFIYQEEKDEEDQINMMEYSIMKYLVTNALFQQFDPFFKPRFPLYSYLEEHPVAGINFYEAFVFSIWLGRRLPTEKEWEKASRGVDGRDYPWGEASGYQNGYANTADFVIGRTSPVEELDLGISPYGCFDMAGNLWEWVAQLHGSKISTLRTVRGGSWLNYLVHAKCHFRNSFDPSERHLAVGLRCVDGPPPYRN